MDSVNVAVSTSPDESPDGFPIETLTFSIEYMTFEQAGNS
jgi:hypothetical protein